MALTMLDKVPDRADHSAWPPAIAAEFEQERQNHNGCVGSALISEDERVRVWMIRLAPGERLGFHRHVLDYFWTALSSCRSRQHMQDGSIAEYRYQPGETRHETYSAGQFRVHDLENIGAEDMVFLNVEFLESANEPLAVPNGFRAAP